MLLAESVDLADMLRQLAALRPVFHSEADLQHAFAWQVRTAYPSVRVRLETRPLPGMRLDLLLSSADASACTAVELKYLTRAWAGEISGERFELKNQGAQDIRAYDVVKDIARVEQFVAATPGSTGVVLCLSNEPSYWRVPSHTRETNAHAFRLHEGTILSGSRTWGPSTGAGTRRGREDPLTLRGAYRLGWDDYAQAPGVGGLFRCLVIAVSGGPVVVREDH